MASGFGVKGNKGRCYAFWMDFSKCMSEADHPTSCAALREDYLECLHHRKEARRRPAPPADGLRNPDFSARRALPPPLAPRLPLARALAAQRSLAPALPSALGTLRRPVLPGFARTSCLACALRDAPSAPQFDRINEVVREQAKVRAAVKAERKAAFEHKWFGCVAPALLWRVRFAGRDSLALMRPCLRSTPLPEGHGGH